MSKEKHTPTPWGLENNCHAGHVKLTFDQGDQYLAEVIINPFSDNGEEEAFANAELIVKAVNNHDRLVEALEQVIEDINTGNYEFGEHMFDEWNQLLTELKS